jgi:hypothetical protein
MKVSQRKLKQIIKEELKTALNEDWRDVFKKKDPIGTEKVVGTKSIECDPKTGKVIKCTATGEEKCPPIGSSCKPKKKNK